MIATERIKIDGKQATVVYLDGNFEPTDKAHADLVKIVYDDFTPPAFAVQETEQREYDESKHPRDDRGRWTESGGDGGDGEPGGGAEFQHPNGETWQHVAQTAADAWHKEHPRVADNTIELVKTIDQAMAEAPQYAHYRDWYERHRPLALDLFGKKGEPYFEKFLAATSINVHGKPNVDEALRATIHFLNGGTFEKKNYRGVMEIIRDELLKIQHGEPVTGPKVEAFAEALAGNWDRAPADRHMRELLFQHPAVSGGRTTWPQAAVAETVVRAIADKMGWKAAELQAVLWCVSKAHDKIGLPSRIFDYLEYVRGREAQVRALMAEHKTLKTRAELNKEFSEDQVGDALAQEAEGWADAELLLEFFQAIHDAVGDETPERIAAALNMIGAEERDFDESKHPRDDRGRWTEGGGGDEEPEPTVGFVSPNVRTDLDFDGAVRELGGSQQRALHDASVEIDDALHVSRAKEVDVIGAWSDGAENSVMMEADSDWDHAVLATVMKGYLADQKSVLVFQQDGGHAVMAQFAANGDLSTIHDNLLKDGLEFHTLEPTQEGAIVHICDLDGSLADAIKKGASRYGKDNRIGIQFGRAEFIPSFDQQVEGSDRAQRDGARRVYEATIQRSSIPRAAEIWKGIRDHWLQTAPLAASYRDWDESKHPRDEHGRFAESGGGDAEDVLNPTGSHHADNMTADDIRFAVEDTKHSFPNIPTKDIKIDGDEDSSYNCIGWAFGDNSRWWWPGGGVYWPNSDSPTIHAFDSLLKDTAHGIETSDQKHEDGFVKLALFSRDPEPRSESYPTHLARQLEDGEWSSKTGFSYLIRHGHDVRAMNGGDYGNLVKIYKVPEAEWKKLAGL